MSIRQHKTLGELELIGWGSVGALEDEQLVLTPEGPGLDLTGYNEDDYWDVEGNFLGADDFGITPIYVIKATGERHPSGAHMYPIIC